MIGEWNLLRYVFWQEDWSELFNNIIWSDEAVFHVGGGGLRTDILVITGRWIIHINVLERLRGAISDSVVRFDTFSPKSQ